MSIFTARCYAKRGICRRRVSVRFSVCACVCVCISATLWYCIKTAKRSITQIMPHDRPGTQMGCFVVAEFLLTSASRGHSRRAVKQRALFDSKSLGTPRNVGFYSFSYLVI